MVAWAEYKFQAKARSAMALELYVVISTPADPPSQVKEALEDHLAYQAQMEREGQLASAGPLSNETGTQMESAGLIIYRAESLHATKVLADGDPMHSSGARTYVLRRWLVNEGSGIQGRVLSDSETTPS
ncbi:MAG: YciI family protein [Amylibacter sp.]